MIVVGVQLDEVEKWISHLRSDPTALARVAVREGAILLQQEILKNVSGITVSGGGATFSVQKRTGKLSRSVDYEYPWGGDPLCARIYADAFNNGVNYAVFLQKGGVIRRKGGKPFCFIESSQGLIILTRENFSQYVSVEEGPPKRYEVTGLRTGRKTSGEAKGKGKAPIYRGGRKRWVVVAGGRLVFTKKVTIGPHPFIQAAWDAKGTPIVDHIKAEWAKDIARYDQQYGTGGPA